MTPGPWLSIVTVVKDDVTGLTRTIKSMQAQDLVGVELVVVDGSSDSAAVPAQLASSAIPSVTEVHEPPRGIYPAMNTGLRLATGDYVLYLNAGDCFDHPGVVACVRELASSQPEWIVGRVRILSPGAPAVVSASWDYAAEKSHLFARGVFPPHQATIARRSLLLAAGGFDTSFAIAADYALALAMSRHSDPLMTDLVIAQFHEGGVSTQQWQESFREFHRARRAVFAPTGLDSVRENVATATHYARVFAYRNVVSRLTRSSA